MRKSGLALSAVSFPLILILGGCGGATPEDEPAQAAPAVVPEPAAPTETAPESPPLASPPLEDLQVTVQPVETPGMDVVRAYTEQFYSGELEQLHERFTEEMKQVLPPDQLRTLYDYVRQEYGEEVEVLGEDAQTKDEYRGFARWARFSNYDGVIEVQWILREDDSVAGFFVQPAKPGPQ